MQYRILTGTRLQVPFLSLGTMTFGGQTDEAESIAIMNYAYDNGINLFDTADTYNKGETEKVVAKGIRGRRDKIILTTKVCNKVGETINESGLSRRHIQKGLEASLRRLDTDYIDIYYLHAPDSQTSMEETMEAMTSLVKAGKICYIGVSNFAAWQIADILAVCDKRNYIAPIITQNVYNAITRSIETELVPFIKAHKINLTVYNPLAAGLLVGKHKPGMPTENTRFSLNKMYADRYWKDANFIALDKLTNIANQAGISMLQLAMKFCAAQKQVVSILTGVSRLSQLEQNIVAGEGNPINDEIMAKCDEVWQYLSGTPFAYAR